MQYKHGWFQVAFEDDFQQEELLEAVVGTQRFVLARTAEGVQAFDAACPHRGANLAYGGRMEGRSIICPFHGYRVGLGNCQPRGYQVRQYPTLVIGGLVLIRLSDSHENGLTEILTEIAADHYFTPGFVRDIKVNAALVIENGFDNLHFKSVHNIRNLPQFRQRQSTHGELAVEGIFEIPPPAVEIDRTASIKVPFLARAFSPGLVISQLGGVQPYIVITSATPLPNDFCRLRLSLAFPGKQAGKPPHQQMVQYLIEQSKIGIERDETIWEHLIFDAPSQLSLRDASVIEFNKFCRSFEVAQVFTSSEPIMAGDILSA